MHARKLFSGLAATAVAVSVVALTATPAFAVYTPDPDDTTFHPGATTDLIGVGSDTTQGVVKVLGDGFNATAPAAKIVSYAATGGGTLDLPDASSISSLPSQDHSTAGCPSLVASRQSMQPWT